MAGLLLLLTWQVYAVLGPLGGDVLPAPTQVMRAGWADRASLARNTLPTMVVVLAGFAASVTVAFVLSLIIDRWRLARSALLPLLIGSQTLPIIVLAPLMTLWFGFGLPPKVLLVALVTFFPIVVGLLDGYSASDRDASALLRTMGAGWWQEFRLVRLPSALPSFFTGLRISVTYAVVAAIFAEYAGAERGLARYLQTAQNSYRPDLVLAAVTVTALLTLLLFAMATAAQRLTVPWHFAAHRLPR